MSDVPVDYRDRLDLREQIGRIDKMREETLKFTAEQHKLMAEAAKLGRDRLLAPWLAIVGLIGGLIAIASAIARWKGWAG
jgi:hypothetical protein